MSRMNTTVSIILALIVLGGVGLCIWLLLQVKKQQQDKTPAIDPQVFLLLQQRLDGLNQELKSTLHEQTRNQQSSSFQMTNAVRDVTERLVRLEETNKQVLNFSSQLDQLQRILSNPKQRGILGEYYLETLLRNVFAPEQYQMQYKFTDGEIVDAVVFVQDKIIPIDSKFSLENYNRIIEEENPDEKARLEKTFLNDLKNRIVETSKYIRPQEGTLDFAFMFIPHEAIYYDLLINKIGTITSETESLLQRAASKYHVIIVSPTSFSAYLQTVLQGLNALKIEQQAQEIRKRVGELSKHLAAYEQSFQNVGKHLGTAVNQYNIASKEYGKIDKDILRITGQSNNVELQVLDKPNQEE